LGSHYTVATLRILSGHVRGRSMRRVPQYPSTIWVLALLFFRIDYYIWFLECIVIIFL
jgi:hypothetical protein